VASLVVGKGLFGSLRAKKGGVGGELRASLARWWRF
jgi:hypothetical protein